jgi:hypothetical protein
MNFTPGTEQLLQGLIILSGLLMIPVIVGVMVVLFQLAFLIHSTSEFLTFASYELGPMVKDIRQMVGHLEEIGERTSSGVQELGNNLQHAAPILQRGLSRFKIGTSALISGITRSFGR